MAVDGKGALTENQVFIYPAEVDLTANDLTGMIDAHKAMVKNYTIARDYYTGQHPILKETQDISQLGKPDNRLVVNYPRYIVDTLNGFFLGIPPKITLDDTSNNEKLQTFNDTNSLYDSLYELSKQVSIYGRSYLYVYQNEAKETQTVVVSPSNAFIVYDDTVAQNPIAFVMYSYDEDNELTGMVVKADGQYDLSLNLTAPNIFGVVPAVEFIENEERQGTFENVETLVDAVNNALSQKANDVDYFADAYLKILGASLDDDTLKNIRTSHIINLAGDTSADIVVDFMEKPNADGEQEHLVNRLNDLIFQIAMVANMSDDTFGNAASGVSLQYKLLSMRNLASNKERKFTKSLREFYRIVFAAGTVLGGGAEDEWQQLKFQFTRNLPSNIADEATVAKNLEGVVSKETQLKALSMVDDPKAEIERMSKEQNIADEQDRQSRSLYDFEKSGDK